MSKSSVEILKELTLEARKNAEIARENEKAEQQRKKELLLEKGMQSLDQWAARYWTEIKDYAKNGQTGCNLDFLYDIASPEYKPVQQQLANALVEKIRNQYDIIATPMELTHHSYSSIEKQRYAEGASYLVFCTSWSVQ